MNCDISNAQWTDYLDGTLPARERALIEAHLRVCGRCQSEMEAARQTERRVRIECGIAKQAIDLPLNHQAVVLDRILAVLEESGDTQPAAGDESTCLPERLCRVRLVLALLCGPNTAIRIVQAAQAHTGVCADQEPAEQSWLTFLKRLAFLTTEICGCFAGDLIWAVGK